MVLRILLLFSSFSLFSHDLIHMDLEMTSGEYNLLLTRNKNFIKNNSSELNAILTVGARIHGWVEELNKFRDSDNQLELTSSQSSGGIPLTDPFYLNEKIVLGLLEDFSLNAPFVIKSVLYSSEPYPSILTISEENFLHWARRADRLYQLAARWILQKRNLYHYSMRAYQDLRGLFYLGQIENLLEKLQQFSTLDHETQIEWGKWLRQVCANARRMDEDCPRLFERALRQNKMAEFYSSHLSGAQSLLRSFYRIDYHRNDGFWINSEKLSFEIPFQKPHDDKVVTFLKNIADRWQHESGFKVELNFKLAHESSPHLVFIPGATASVNGLGGNRITMDANRSLDDYINQWILAHEFGHVLGFPDCYVEFYDKEDQVMVHYQLDTTNIMCSRGGVLQLQHIQELRRVYKIR